MYALRFFRLYLSLLYGCRHRQLGSGDGAALESDPQDERLCLARRGAVRRARGRRCLETAAAQPRRGEEELAGVLVRRLALV